MYKKYAFFLTFFNNDGKVIDFLRHISESYTYFNFIFTSYIIKHIHILMSVIFQEELHILYSKIIPTISQKFDSNFGGPKLAHTL